MSTLKIQPGKVYGLFGTNGITEVQASGLPLGQVVSYGDAANARQEAVVIEEEGSPYGQECIFREDYHKSHVSITAIEGPGGWHLEREVVGPEEIALLKIRHAQRRKELQDEQQQKLTQREATLARGKAIYEQEKPAWAKAAILASLEEDQSDSQSDYFASRTATRLFLAWSKHTKDRFDEMRKAAALRPETEHLGPGKDVYRVYVQMEADVYSNGTYYHKGQASYWHKDMEPESAFTTQAEVDAFLATAPALSPLSFEDSVATFSWATSKESIEHREKYSMGHGYYLGRNRYAGWQVSKRSLDYSLDEIYLALANTADRPLGATAQESTAVALEQEDRPPQEQRWKSVVTHKEPGYWELVLIPA